MTDCDVLVIGGGPAGSTAAAFLAQRGRSVIQIERQRHPRFHIGESLLPANLPILERLGVLEQVRAIGVLKRGADFPTNSKEGFGAFRFERALGSTPGYAFQVKREEFDQLLFRHAQAAGADGREGERVRSVAFSDRDAIAEVQRADGGLVSVRARYVVDATGRDSLLGTALGLRRKHPRHQSAALFAHFSGVVPRTGKDAGNISIYLHEHGWAWMIPLRDGVFSVGIVANPELFRTRRESPTDFMMKVLGGIVGARERMARAAMIGNQHATGNYSYLCSRLSGRRWIMVGDAGAFVDPIFSTGVFLGMRSAESAAGLVDQVLQEPSREASLQRAYEREVWGGLRALSWFIERFNSPAMRWLFANPSNAFGMQRAVISMLAGDVFGAPDVRRRLAAFKFVYYLITLRRLAGTMRYWFVQRRRLSAVFLGETIQTGGSQDDR